MIQNIALKHKKSIILCESWSREFFTIAALIMLTMSYKICRQNEVDAGNDFPIKHVDLVHEVRLEFFMSTEMRGQKQNLIST